MLPIKKILLPTDFSEPSYEALKNRKRNGNVETNDLFRK